MDEAKLRKVSLRVLAVMEQVKEAAKEMEDDHLSNCILWAVRQRASHGGYLALIPSKYGPWEHVCWLAPDGTFWEYNPPHKEIYAGQSLPPTLFEGEPVIRQSEKESLNGKEAEAREVDCSTSEVGFWVRAE